MSTDYRRIKEHCHRTSRISEEVIDNFLFPLIAVEQNYDRKMKAYERQYKHIIKQMPESFFPSVMTELVVGKAFQAGGLIHRYLKHPEVVKRGPEITQFLAGQSSVPWRYCFAYIQERPYKEFFHLMDAFTGDELLLYSPGMETYWQEGRHDDLYFMLLGFNGDCWQSYGLILPFRSFDPEDIYYYGTELFPSVECDQTLMESVYDNPMAYFMLARGMEYPVTVSGGHRLGYTVAVDEIDGIDTEKLKQTFRIQWNKDIYRISHHQWSEPPHFAHAYYLEKTGELHRIATTEDGFDEMTTLLIQNGLPIEEDEDFSVGMSMMVTMSDVLKRKIVVDEYERYFPDKKDEHALPDEELEKINDFLQLLMPYINTGKKPDLKALARQSGISPDTARQLYEQLNGKYGR